MLHGQKYRKIAVDNDLRQLNLEEQTGGKWFPHPPQNPIVGIHFDSRELSPGEMFIAIGDPKKNSGHKFLAHAQRRGASAAIVMEFHEELTLPQLLVQDSTAAFQSIATAYRKTLPTEIIAVAGSYGKTTTKDLLTLLLGPRTYKTSENQNSQLGTPLNVLKISSKLHLRAVIEVGIEKPGDMQKQTEIVRAKHVIFTGISHKHVEFFSTREELLLEKLHIAKYIAQQRGKFVAEKSLSQHYLLRNLRECIICTEDTIEDFRFPTPSSGFRKAFSLCHCLCKHLGISHEDMRDRLRNWEASRLREQILMHKTKEQIFYVDCYNSDIEPLLNSAKTFFNLFHLQKRLFVIGGMSGLGFASKVLHEKAGKLIPFSANDHFIFVGNETAPMLVALRGRGLPEGNAQIFPQKTESIKEIINNFRGAVYLKGSRCYALETLIDFDNCRPFVY